MICVEEPIKEAQSGEVATDGQSEAKGAGGEHLTSFFEVEVCFPALVARSEWSDTELLQAAHNAGSFAYLEYPSEDVYNEPSPA